MQHIIGYMRRAIQDYKMILPGDKVAVGLSGGKDSVALLAGLERLKRHVGMDFELVAITLDPCFGGVNTDYSPIEAFCENLGIEYILKRTDIGHIVFDIRNEPNPCSLCARMRRGLLHDTMKEAGCNKLALGHHYDDAVETFVMNLFHEARIGCFSPVTYMSRKDITVIRPLVLAPEREIRRAVANAQFPVVKSRCLVDGATSREDTKNWLVSMEKDMPGITKRLFGAMKRSGIDGW
ncbi:ATP-binding protein [Oscillospiraceae bacterium MB08-C2-2]|nr:ATP-binding protein [Oscillospiraceae bacterium MB08-C2-2]